MTLKELEENIRINNVPEELYSIDQGVKPNAFILYKNHQKWEYFYIDEKGNRQDLMEFYDDNEAYTYLWGKIKNEMKYSASMPPKSVYGK